MNQEIQLIRNVTKHFGNRPTEMKRGARAVADGFIQTALWDFDFNDLPVGGATNLELSIPALSTILSAKLRIITAFTSTSATTDLTVGLEQADGTDIDVDGLITAAQATQTTIAVVGSIIDGASGTAGALINATIGAAAGEVVVIPSVDDLLTGRAQIIVEYLIPAPSPDGVA